MWSAFTLPDARLSAPGQRGAGVAAAVLWWLSHPRPGALLGTAWRRCRVPTPEPRRQPREWQRVPWVGSVFSSRRVSAGVSQVPRRPAHACTGSSPEDPTEECGRCCWGFWSHPPGTVTSPLQEGKPTPSLRGADTWFLLNRPHLAQEPPRQPRAETTSSFFPFLQLAKKKKETTNLFSISCNGAKKCNLAFAGNAMSSQRKRRLSVHDLVRPGLKPTVAETP